MLKVLAGDWPEEWSVTIDKRKRRLKFRGGFAAIICRSAKFNRSM